jgi:hypothetical protein
MRRRNIAVLSVLTILVLGLAFLAFVWNPLAFLNAQSAPQENQIQFIGAGFNDSNAVRNSNVTGTFGINVTAAGKMQFTLDDETYYPPNSTSYANSTTIVGLPVHTFKTGTLTIDGTRFNFVVSKPCLATIASTQTNGSTIIAYASCSASTTPAVIAAGPIPILEPGVWRFGYSFEVPDNATIGTYLVDVLIQNLSAQNFADMSNNLVYVLKVNVTQ